MTKRITRTRISQNKLVTFEPVWSDAEVDNLELNYDKNFGAKRRITQVALARSFDQLLEGLNVMDDQGAALFCMIENIKDYQNHLKSGIELTDAAIARLLLVARHAAEGAAS